MGISVLRECYGTILCAILIISNLILNKNKYGRRICVLFMVTISLVLIESVAGSMERYLGNALVYHPARLALSWLCYCLGPAILLCIAETIMRDSRPAHRWAIAVPEMVNIIVTSTAFFGPWCFSMDADINHFVAGPLIIVPRGSVILYLLIVVIVAFANVRKSKFEATTVLIGAVLISINYIDEVELNILGSVRETTIAIAILAYYMYFLSSRHMDEVNVINEKFVKSEEQHNKNTIDQCIETLAFTIDAKDKYTKGHSTRVAKYARLIATVVGKSEEECRKIYLTGLLHDIGKISIRSSIINKDGRLTDDEYETIKMHPQNGAIILEKMRENPYLQEGAMFHHERYDGKGYPRGLSGEEIPEYARIIAVADAYDAMSSNRSYRSVMDQALVKEEIWKGMGTQFDPLFAKIMISLIDADHDYDMREKPGESDEILFDDKNRSIVWRKSAPKKISSENVQLQETDYGYLAAYVCAEDHWCDPFDGIKVNEGLTKASFIGRTRPDGKYVWNAPVIILYHAQDGRIMGEGYEELAVMMCAGYSWGVNPTIPERITVSREAGFLDWDNWKERNREGLIYKVEATYDLHNVYINVSNELIAIRQVVKLPKGFDKNIYLAFTGERADISQVKCQ